MEIPIQELSEEILIGIIKEFVLQEGTEYGPDEVSLEDKIMQVRQQLESGKAKVMFDADTESCTIVTAGRDGTAGGKTIRRGRF